VKSSPVSALVAIPGVGLLILTIVIPGAALLVRSFQLGTTAGWTGLAEGRYWTLLGHTLLLAAGGAVLTLLMSLPGAYVVGRLGRIGRQPVVGVLLLVPLLVPPMVYAFAWQKIAPRAFGGVTDVVRCLWVWACWCWPIPAALIGTDWARRGRRAFEAAVLEGSSRAAFVRVVFPLLTRNGVLGLLIVFALLMGEYSVPHACGLVVAATSLLGWATESSRPADVLLPALPMVGAAAVTLLAVGRRLGRGDEDAETEVGGALSAATGGRRAIVVASALVGGTVVLPVAALVVHLASWAVFVQTLRTHAGELVESLVLTLIAGMASVVMGLSLAAVGTGWKAALGGAVLFGVVPGALVGEAVLVAYQPVDIVYDNWLLLVIGYVARFGWIGLLVAWLAGRSAGQDVVAQARTDGASETQVSLRVRYRANVVLLLAGAAVIAVLSLAEVAAASLLQVPAAQPISLILIEKFHRFEDGAVISLSLCLVGAAVPGALLTWAALRRWA